MWYILLVLKPFGSFYNTTSTHSAEQCPLRHTWRPIVFIEPGLQDMSIIICASKVAVK